MLLLGSFLLLLAAPRAFAHGISVWAEVLEDGETVSVEVYFSDGKPAVGAGIEVFAEQPPARGEGEGDASGESGAEPIARGETDSEGRFRFRPEAPGALRIHASAGGHHRAEARIEADAFGS